MKKQYLVEGIGEEYHFDWMEFIKFGKKKGFNEDGINFTSHVAEYLRGIGYKVSEIPDFPELQSF